MLDCGTVERSEIEVEVDILDSETVLVSWQYDDSRHLVTSLEIIYSPAGARSGQGPISDEWCFDNYKIYKTVKKF